MHAALLATQFKHNKVLKTTMSFEFNATFYLLPVCHLILCIVMLVYKYYDS